MLRTVVAVAVALAASLIVVMTTAPTASADCTANPETGEVDCDAEEGGDSGGGSDDTGGSSTCNYQSHEIPCTGPAGSFWSSSHGCYVGDVWDPGGGGALPPPGQTNEDGAWHVCFWPPPGSSWDPVWIQNGKWVAVLLAASPGGAEPEPPEQPH